MNINAVSIDQWRLLLKFLGIEEESCSHENRPERVYTSYFGSPECPDCLDTDSVLKRKPDLHE